jgi:Uncharacterized conserved protein
MHGHVRFEGDPPSAKYHRRFLTGAEEVAPTPDIKELWFGLQAGKPLKISVTFEDDATFSVVLRQQFGQLHVSAEDLPKDLTAKKTAKYLGTQVAFIPGLVGVLVAEPYATRARRNALATQGRYSEIFRSSLQQLHAKSPELVTQINQWLGDLFGVAVKTVAFDPEADEFVTVKYEQSGVAFDVVSSGAGLQQVIQMLTYLYLTQPRVLLIDEPDSHLHSKLQARLGDLFRRVSGDLGAQVFLSTHSVDLIDTFSTREVLVVDAGKRVIAPIGKNADLVTTLVDANVVDISSLSRLLASRRLVVVEDEDQVILKAIDKAIGSPLFSARSNSYVLPAKGVGNFRALSELGKVLKGLTGTEFDLTFVQDRDGMPDFVNDAFRKAQEAEGVGIQVLGRHEIESYLVEPALMSRAAELTGRKLTGHQASEAIRKAGKGLKARARRASLDTAKGVNRHLPTPDRWKDSELEEKVYEWFDGLNTESVEVIQNVFPGKELLKEVLKILNEGAEKEIRRGHLVAAISSEAIAKEICDLLTAIGEAKPGKPAPREQKRIGRRARKRQD